MDRLPGELWQMIFEICGAGLKTALVMRLVCTKWRSLVKRLRVSVSIARIRPNILEALAASFPNVACLDIRHWKGDMRFSAFDQFSSKFPSLTRLHLERPGKKDLLYLPKMTSLQQLELSNNYKAFGAEHLVGLSVLHRLHRLVLIDATFDADALAATVSSLPIRVLQLRSHLLHVKLSPTPVDARDVSARSFLGLLAPLSSRLQELAVEQHPVPAEIGCLTGLTKLKLLNALIEPTVLHGLASSLTHLHSLTVTDAWPAGDDGVSLTALGNLRTLCLRTAKLVATNLLPVLTAFSALRRLELACSVSGSAPAIPSLPALRRLSLCWTSDTTLPDLSFLSVLTGLRFLELGKGRLVERRDLFRHHVDRLGCLRTIHI